MMSLKTGSSLKSPSICYHEGIGFFLRHERFDFLQFALDAIQAIFDLVGLAGQEYVLFDRLRHGGGTCQAMIP